MVFAKLMRAASIGMAATLALTLGTTGSMAADTKKPAAGAAAPAAAPAQAADTARKPGDVWYKICMDAPVPEPVKLSEPPKQQKPEEIKKVNMCITQVDVRDNVIGALRGKLAIRRTAGQEKPQLMAMLPLGEILPLGALVKIDDKEPIKLTYQSCDQAGCYAEAAVEPAVVDSMKTGKQIAYLGIDVNGQSMSIPLPLASFAKAYDGQPIPMEKYTEDQKKIADFIRQRVAELRKQQEEAQKNGGAAAVPAAPAPAADPKKK